MTPERQKKLRDSLGWNYDPECICGLCAEYRDGLVSLDAGVPVDSEITDARTLRRLSADMAPPAKVGTNAKVEGAAWAGKDIPGVYVDEFRADELGSKKPKTESDRRKATPIFSGVMRYFPDALAAVARLSKAGNDKHNPGQPLHWAREKSTDHGDCIARHQISFEEVDPETGEYHAAAVAWRALAQLQLLEEKKRKAAEEPNCGEQEPEIANPWRRWLPSWRLKPMGRVDVRLRSGILIPSFSAENLDWGDCGQGTITEWRRAA